MHYLKQVPRESKNTCYLIAAENLTTSKEKWPLWWWSSGQVLAFYFNNPSSNADEVYSFNSVKVIERTKINGKEAGNGHKKD